MRPLLILCEPHHVGAVSESVRLHSHPTVRESFVGVIGVTTDGDQQTMRLQQAQALAWLNAPQVGASDVALVAATKEVVAALRLRGFAKAAGFELSETTAHALTKKEDKGRTSEVQGLLNRCNLSLLNAASLLLRSWDHSVIDRQAVDRWIHQFQQLGKNVAIGRAILASLKIVERSQLGDLLFSVAQADDSTLCVNKDPRGSWKSAEVIGNLLEKRHTNRTIHPGPADAIEKGAAKGVLMFEDGLWSGTEAVGIIDSLLGERNDRLKTRALENGADLRSADVTMVYAMGTDYGQAVLRLYLERKGLSNLKVHCAQTVKVATDDFLASINQPGFDLAALLRQGPSSGVLKPFFIDHLVAAGLPPGEVQKAHNFCTHVGRKLFANYIQHKVTTSKWSWVQWPGPKLEVCALGMHGLGMTHAFGHSIPKASLPLLWSSGPVEFNGHKVDWKPLFLNGL